VANRTVRPSAASACIVAQKSRRAEMSMPAVGSSRTSRSGSGRSDRANLSRCCSPPESFATLRRASAVKPARAITSSTGTVVRNVEAIIRTVSSTDRSRSRPPLCRTAETRPAATASRGPRPKMLAVPDVGLVRPSTMSSSVVLPAPLGPSRATTSPASTVRSTPATARTGAWPGGVKVLRTSSTAMAGGSSCVMDPEWGRRDPRRDGRLSRFRHDGCQVWRRGRYRRFL
jgi:hypothetical protein